jgi:hypothetical protein
MAIKAAPIISNLEAVKQHIADDKERGTVVRAQARALNNMAAKLLELQETLEGLGSDGDIQATVGQLQSWADLLDPRVSATWSKEEVEEDLKKLQAMAVLDMLTPDEVDAMNQLTEELKAAKVGGGERAPRTPQPKIEGRPESVSVAGADNKVFSVQSGNVANSGPNLKAAAINYIKRTLNPQDPGSVVVDDEIHKGLLAAAKEVVEARSTESTYEGVTFRVHTDS